MFVLQHNGAAYEIATLQVLGVAFNPAMPYPTFGPGPFKLIGFASPTWVAGPDGVPVLTSYMSWGVGFVQTNPGVGGLASPNDATSIVLAADKPQAWPDSGWIIADTAGVVAFARGTVSVHDRTAVVDMG